MIKLSKVATYTEIPVVVNQPEEIAENEAEKRFGSCVFFDDVLISRHHLMIKIWDLKKLPEIQMISSFEIDWKGGCIKKYGNLLYVGQENHIKVFNIVDLTKPLLVRTFKVSDYVNFHVADGLVYVMIDKAIYTMDEGGELLKIIDLSSYDPDRMMFYTKMDMNKVGDTLFLAFTHCGLYAFTQSKETGMYEFKSKNNPAQSLTPTYIQWKTVGEQLLLVGNDNVVLYNVSNPSKIKRYKSAKIKSNDICQALVQRDNELLVVGEGSKRKFIVAVLSSDMDGVKVLQTPKLEYKPRVEIAERLSGVTVKDNYLLIVGTKTGFYLFEAGE